MTDTVKHMWDEVEKARADGTFSSEHAAVPAQCGAGRTEFDAQGEPVRPWMWHFTARDQDALKLKVLDYIDRDNVFGDHFSENERNQIFTLLSAPWEPAEHWRERAEHAESVLEEQDRTSDDQDRPAKWLDGALRDLARELVADPKTPWIGERDPKQHICWTAADRLAARTPAEGEWQPISTAPKDGTTIDLWHPEKMFMTDTVKHMWDEVEKARADGTFSSEHAAVPAQGENACPWCGFSNGHHPWCRSPAQPASPHNTVLQPPAPHTPAGGGDPELMIVGDNDSAGVVPYSANEALAEIDRLREELSQARAQVESAQSKLIEANNKLIGINHALLNREDPDWKVLAAARSAAFTSTVRAQE